MLIDIREPGHERVTGKLISLEAVLTLGPQ